MTTTQQAALQKIAEAAVASERATGCPAEMSCAQAIFESSWLTRFTGANNCFGIKVHSFNTGHYSMTHEVINGKPELIEQCFEAYDSLADCFADHARLLQNGVYAAAWAAYQKSHDVASYITAIAKFYATDLQYAAKIRAEANSDSVRQAVIAARTKALA